MTTAPTIASSTTTAPSSASTTLTLTKPSGVANGDLLVILCASSASSANGFNSAPAGWTSIQYAGYSGGGSLGAYWRFADGSEGATLDVTQTSSTRGAGLYLRITGADPTTPIAGVGTATSTAGTQPTSGIGSSASMENTLRFWAFGIAAWPSGGGFWTTTYSTFSVLSGIGQTTLSVNYRADSASGSSGTNSITWGDSEDTGAGAGFGFSIAPGPDPIVLPPALRASHLQAVHPDVLRGRGMRSPLNAPDFVPPPAIVPPSRRALQLPVPGRVLEGRSLRPEWAPLAVPYFPPNPPPSRRALQPCPPGQVLVGRARRSPPIPVVTWLRRELALRFPIDVLAPQLFRVVARNTATDAETVLGTCTAAAPTIGSVSLADGDYVLRVEVDGEYWRRARVLQEWPVRIAGGAVTLPMPPVNNLQVVWQDGVPVLHWTWDAAAGYGTPTSFAVRSGASNPPTTPAGSVTATAPAGYQLTLSAPVSATYYGVAAFDGASVYGPLSVVLVSPVVSLDHPRPQSMRRGDGDWLTS